MAALDPVNAFVDRAQSIDRGEGALAGVRLAVKDNMAVAGRKWTAGLPLLADRIAREDAPSVAMLRAAGAAVVGTVATDAAGFGMMTPGVINPLARDRTVGGSSGGSAAAVAAGLVDLALGTDTAGSVRVPAACCGTFGLKPTYGRVSVDGVTPLSFTFDHVGLLATDLNVLERGTRVLLQDAADITVVPRRIGFDPGRLAGSDEAIQAAIERTLAWLSGEGFVIEEIELPECVALAEMHGVIVCHEALEIWKAHWPHDAAKFADTARRSLAYAASLSPETLGEAKQQLVVARAKIAKVFEDVEAIVGPTIAVPPPKVGARRVPFCGIDAPVVFALLAETCAFNVSGNPALSMPLPWLGQGGIPVSLQIATRHDHDLGAIGIARLLQQMPSIA